MERDERASSWQTYGLSRLSTSSKPASLLAWLLKRSRRWKNRRRRRQTRVRRLSLRSVSARQIGTLKLTVEMGTKRAAVECRRYKRRPGRQGEEATRAWRRPASRRELRNTIARERGIAAYRAWVPFERIRPVNIPQEKWEETFAWPANNEPPYPPLAQRILRRLISYVAVILVAAVLLQVFTPFPVLTWLAALTKRLI